MAVELTEGAPVDIHYPVYDIRHGCPDAHR